MSEPGKDILKVADVAMWESPPMPRDEKTGLVEPKVYLLNATPDPLGTLAACEHMYAGNPTYDLSEITDDQRKWAWDEVLKTKLQAPLEFIDLHWYIEGVTRSFTHQMVRQRTAVYVQESLRFAVKRGIAVEAALPPTIVGGDDNVIAIWRKVLDDIEEAYEGLIDSGIPAEDARALLPHATTTRIHYKTNLRNFIDHAGMRLCTQAQFEWRKVWWGFLNAMAKRETTYWRPHPSLGIHPADGHWQWELIAKPHPTTFAPACYHIGKCAFMGDLDRHCNIRERVEAFHKAGVEPMLWGIGHYAGNAEDSIPRIHPEEWMSDHTAARLAPEEAAAQDAMPKVKRG